MRFHIYLDDHEQPGLVEASTNAMACKRWIESNRYPRPGEVIRAKRHNEKAEQEWLHFIETEGR